MKKIILTLLIFCVWASIAFGGMVIQKVSTDGANPNCYGASPTGCLFYENVDGSTACVAGNTTHCNNTWTSAIGSPDYSDTTLGTYTFEFYGVSYEGLTKDWTQVNDIYLATKFRIDTLPGATNPYVWFRRADNNYVAQLVGTSGGEFGVRAAGGSYAYTTGTKLVVDTDYYLKFRVQRSGDSITADAWYATVDGSWNHIGQSTGSMSGVWAHFRINTVDSTVRTAFFKDIRLSASDITSFGQ